MKDIWKPEWDELIEAAYSNAVAGVEKSEATQVIDQIFANILQLWVNSINVRDEWEYYLGSYTNFRYYYGIARSCKLKEDFDFGLYRGKICLETSFIHPCRIRYMGDEFWDHLIELNKCGDCRFTENAGLAGDNGKLIDKYSSSKSNVFNIIKNYLILEIFGNGSGDLGGLEVTWSKDVDRNKLLVNGAIAMFHMYKMNYLLHRNYQQYLYGVKKTKS